MKKAGYNLLMQFAMMGMMFPLHSISSDYELTENEIKRLKEIASVKAKERLLQRGLKQFEIKGVPIIALNRKNAIRKYNNMKEILKT